MFSIAGFSKHKKPWEEIYGPPDGKEYDDLVKNFIGFPSSDWQNDLENIQTRLEPKLAEFELQLRKFPTSHDAIKWRISCLRTLGRNEEADAVLAIGASLYPESLIMLMKIARRYRDSLAPEARQALMNRGFNAYQLLHPDATKQSYEGWFLSKTTDKAD